MIWRLRQWWWLAGIDREAQPVSNPYKFTAEIAWLQEAARYFSKRPTSGEDAAHWSNVYNAENANKIASRLDALSRPMEALAWREKVAREVCRIVRTWQGFKATPEYTLEMEVENAWDDWLPEADRILQALAVIPTEGLGSSAEGADTHRVAETAVVGWQPIENAPEVDYDAPVLVFSAGDPPAYDMAWVGWHDEAGKPVWYNGDVAVVWATHWMPLPAAPVSDAIGEESQ